MKDLEHLGVLSTGILINFRYIQGLRSRILSSPCLTPEPIAMETITVPQEEPTPAREPLTTVSDRMPSKN
jgi:hypothetical protein